MKINTLSKSNGDKLVKHNMGLWQLYNSSFETIWYRLNMMITQPSNHPEFTRMIKEKEYAFNTDLTNGMAEIQKQMMSFCFSPYSVFNVNKLVNNSLKISDSLSKVTNLTATANAKRLRTQ